MSKVKPGVSGTRKSSRRPVLREEQTAHCSTSNFQPNVTYGDCDETAHAMPGSLAGMSPSSRGHTMKECEEQLSHLHKENFNLKLRIYFLEERLGHRRPDSTSGGTDDFAAWEESLRAEAVALRAELAEKQQLLCHAASAIDLVERKHGDEVAELRAERLALEGQLTQLQQTSNERVKQLEAEVAHVSGLCVQQREELTSLADQARQRSDVISVGIQCVDTGSASQQDKRIMELAQELQVKGREVADAEQRIRGLEEALGEIQPEIQIKVQELRERDNRIEEKQHQIEQQNRVLVEIQITLAEKQRLIDALNSSISARDVKIAQLECQLVHLESQLAQAQAAIRAGETRLQEETHELSRVRGENEMLKTQMKRMNRSREERELPRRRSNLHTRDSISPRSKSLIEEGIEGIWSSPMLRGRDEFSPLEEKENLWKVNELKEKTDKSQQSLDFENKVDRKSDRFSEENFLKLEKEHQRGCEAIQGFITRIKHLANENEHLRRESKKTEKKMLELNLEAKELRDSYNKAKWEARQLEADATGLPGTLADVKDMTEEENERLWAEVEDRNKKYAQLSLEMETQVQALLTTLKEKEALLRSSETKLVTCEGDIGAREKRIKELEEKVFQQQRQIRSLLDSQPTENITNNLVSLDSQNGLPNNIINDLEIGLKQSMLNLHDIFGTQLLNNSTIDNLQECLNIIFKKREMDIVSLQHQVEFKDLQLKSLTEKVAEFATNKAVLSVTNESVPINITQHLHIAAEQFIKGTATSEHSRLSTDLACKGMLLSLGLEQQAITSANEQTNLHREVESLRKKLYGAEEQDSDRRALTAAKLECNKLKDDLCASEVVKKNATNACSLLVGRLEELAGFLVSLLRHPERLGNLETNHCRFIKQAVQRSVNLSRQLSMSITQNEEKDCSHHAANSMLLDSVPNVSLSLVGQYLDGVNETSSTLNDIPITSCSTNTLDELCGFNSNEADRTLEESLPSPACDESDKTEVIARLRSQIETLKLEIKQRDIELHCLTQEHNLIKMSSPLFDLTNHTEEHPLSSITFYNNYYTANKESSQAGNLKSKSRNTKGMVLVEMRGDIDDCVDNSTDHVQLPEPTRASINVSMQSQLANTNLGIGKHSRSVNVVTLNTQHDTALALSESETWSEPDRQISLARIGLPEEKACLGSPNVTNFRHHHSRTVPELDESSESSQETAREINRTPGKRRSDAFELRRLQARLRGLEQVNEALRTELTILHQVTPVSHLSSCRESPILTDNNEKDTSDTLTNCKVVETNENPPLETNVVQVDNPVVIPSHLLEEIKHQREKLESSLFHNDFIRRQLEEVFLSATGRPSGVKLDDGTPSITIEGSSENLQETQSIVSIVEAKLLAAEEKAKQLEERLQEAEHLLAESREQAKAVAQVETLYNETRQALSMLQGLVSDLELQLKTKEAEIKTKEDLIATLEDKLLEQHAEITRIVQEITDLKVESEKKVAQAEERVMEVKNGLLSKVEDIEREMMSYEKKNKITEGELKEAKDNLNEAILQKNEANKIIEMMKVEFSTKILVYEETQMNLELQIERSNEESSKEMERRCRKLEEAEKQLQELRWVYKAEVERKVRDAERMGSDVEAGLRRQVDVAERKLRDVEESSREREADLRLKVQESEKRFLDHTVALRQQQDEAKLAASQAELDRTRLANEKLRLEQEIRRLETRETELTAEHRAAEGKLFANQERLNEQLLVLRRQRNELEQKVLELETANSDLKFQLDRMGLSKDGGYRGPWGANSPSSIHGHLRPEPGAFSRDNSSYMSGRGSGYARSPPDSARSPLSSLVLQRGFGRQHSDFSDYVSEDQEYETVVTTQSSYWITTVTGGRHDAAGAEPRINSPDLGIESDQGRLSSLETPACTGATDVDASSSAVQKYRHGGSSDHNCKAIKEKNIELTRELCQTRRALEDTLAQLTASNHRKQNVEKAICKQLQKTHSILMKTRGNLQSEHLMLCDDQT